MLVRAGLRSWVRLWRRVRGFQRRQHSRGVAGDIEGIPREPRLWQPLCIHVGRVRDGAVAVRSLARILTIAHDDESWLREVERRLVGPRDRAVEVPLSQAPDLGNFLVQPFTAEHFVDAALGAYVVRHTSELAGKLSGFAQHSR